MNGNPWDVSNILLANRSGELLGQGISQAGQALGSSIAQYGQVVAQGLDKYYEKQQKKQLEDQAVSTFQNIAKQNPQIAASLGLRDINDTGAIKAAVNSLGGAAQALQFANYVNAFQRQQQEDAAKAKVMQNIAMMNQFGGAGAAAQPYQNTVDRLNALGEMPAGTSVMQRMGALSPGAGPGVLSPQAGAQIQAMQQNPFMRAQQQFVGSTGQLASPKDLMDYAQAQATMKKPQGQFMTAAEFNAYKEQNKGMDIKAIPVDGGVMVTGLETYAPSNPTVIKTGDDQVAKQLFSSMTDMQAKAQQAANTLSSISVAKDIINNKDFVSGAMAEPKLYAYKLAKAMGYQGDEAQNTEVLRAQIAVPVFQILKSLGSGSGVSDKDLEFAQKVVGGQISLEPESIKRLLEIGEKASRKIVNSYNQRLDKTYPKGNKDYEQARNFLELTSAETELPAVGQITPSPANNPVALPDGWSIRSR